MQLIREVDVAVAVCRQTHRDGAVRPVHGGEIVVFGLNDFLIVVEQEVHRSVVAAEQGNGCLLVLSLVVLQGGGGDAATFGIHGEGCQVVLDGDLRILSPTGVEEEGGGVGFRFRFPFVRQGCFRFRFQVGFALLHLGDGVVVALLRFQLFLCRTAEVAEPH